MTNSILKTLVLIAVMSIGLSAADNSIGIWKRNEAKSKGSTIGANPITSLTWNLEEVAGGVKATATGSFKDGRPFKTEFTVKYDGNEYPVTGAPWDRTAIKQIDANTFEWDNRSTTGQYRSKARVRVSGDGKTMTMNTTAMDSEGQPFTSMNVYDRQ
jgi:hypothetical protein